MVDNWSSQQRLAYVQHQHQADQASTTGQKSKNSNRHSQVNREKGGREIRKVMNSCKALKSFQSKNWCYVKEYLDALAQLSEDNEFSCVLSKASFESLEFKLFDEICYFLMKLLNEDMSIFVWPIIDKKHHIIFIKKVFERIEHFKGTKHKGFPNYQKSHFQDPRPENDKVLDFLIHLCDLTVDFIIENGSRKELSGCSCDEELTKVIASVSDKNALLTEHACQLACFKSKVNGMKHILEVQKDKLIQAGIHDCMKDLDEDVIDNKQHQLAEKLFLLVNMLNNIPKKM